MVVANCPYDQSAYCKHIGEAERIIRDAAKLITNAKQKRYVEKDNDPTNLVTETDIAVQSYIFTQLREIFADHRQGAPWKPILTVNRFVGEESLSDGDCSNPSASEFVWILDPVDGTMNFCHKYEKMRLQFSNCAVSPCFASLWLCYIEVKLSLAPFIILLSMRHLNFGRLLLMNAGRCSLL